MTIKKLTMPEFLTLYAIKPRGAGDNGGNLPGHPAGFKMATGGGSAMLLKLLNKNPAVILDEGHYVKAAVPLHSHRRTESRCTITHTPRPLEKIPFHVAVRTLEFRKYILKYRVLIGFNYAATPQHGDNNAY